jgi:hypothetical protein
VITRAALEPLGDQFLLRLVTDRAVIDVLTDKVSMKRAREVIERQEPVLAEARLGSFGPFQVTLSTSATGEVAIAVDGPDLGPAVRGNQAIVFYATRAEAAELLRSEVDAPAT